MNLPNDSLNHHILLFSVTGTAVWMLTPVNT